jgi:hypothetical protein
LLGTHYRWGSNTLTFDASYRSICQRIGDEAPSLSLGVRVGGVGGADDVPSEVKGNEFSVTAEYVCAATAAAAAPFLSLSPMFYPSPSGTYCIVHW